MPVFDFFHRDKDKGYTLAETGAILQVTVGLPVALKQYCLKENIAIPPPVPGYALIDTGASSSAVHEQIFTDFGIQPIDHIAMSTPHTKDKNSFIYPAKIQFPGLNLGGNQCSNLLGWLGANCSGRPSMGKKSLMLMGRDLLKYFLMVYNGVQSDITLAY